MGVAGEPDQIGQRQRQREVVLMPKLEGILGIGCRANDELSRGDGVEFRRFEQGQHQATGIVVLIIEALRQLQQRELVLLGERPIDGLAGFGSDVPHPPTMTGQHTRVIALLAVPDLTHEKAFKPGMNLEGHTCGWPQTWGQTCALTPRAGGDVSLGGERSIPPGPGARPVAGRTARGPVVSRRAAAARREAAVLSQ